MMLELVKLINCIIFAVLDVFLIYELRASDIEIKSYKIKWPLTIISSILILLIANYLVSFSFKLMIVVISFYVICQLLYKTSIIKKMFICVIAVSIAWVIDLIVSFIFMFILKIEMINVNTKLENYILFNSINIVFYTLVILFFKSKRWLNDIKNDINSNTKKILFAIILFQFLNVFVQFFIGNYLLFEPNFYLISLASYLCSIASIAILLYSANIIIDKENIIKITKEYNENLSVYNGVLQDSIENQRKIAHEHGNQLSILSGYIASKNLEKAQDYIEKIIGTCNVDNEMLSHVKESGLKALLVYKNAIIERKNIDFELVIDEYIENTIIPSVDLCQIIGIFLDNAIEAAVQSEEPYITMSILKNDNELDIIIMNSIKDENIDTERIYQKGYSSKGNGRGFGLHIVDEIVKKYEELNLQTRIEDKLFIQELRVVGNTTTTSSTML